MRILEVPGGRHAVLHHKGPYAELNKAYRWLYRDWLPASARVELDRPKSAIGRNTITAIQSGILFGYVGLIEGIVHRMKIELGQEARVIGTGGYAAIIAKETDVIDDVNPNLTLEGLRLIHDMNRA